MIKVFKNQKDTYAKAYKNCDIIGVLRPHKNFWNGAYVQENFIEGFDIIYVAVTSKGYIAFPKEMPEIWQTMIEDKANEYANNHFAHMDISYQGFPAITVTYNNFNFGAGAIQSHDVRQKICDMLQTNGFYILVINEDQIICIPTEVKGIKKEKIKKFIIAFANKTDNIITHNIYQYNKETDLINIV